MLDVAVPPGKVWIGLEYFCNDSDELWHMSDEELIALGARELDHIEILDRRKVLDGVVIRMPKTYPAYFGTYDRFDELQGFLDRFQNLFLVGRNGMHKYNNQDHAMLTAMTAVENVAAGSTEEEYHEELGEDEGVT